MDYVKFGKVMQRTNALVKGEGGEVGLLRNGKNPRTMDECDLRAYIQKAGIEDITEAFVQQGIELTHKSLAAAAFAISELEETKPQVPVPSTSYNAPVAGSFIGQNQLLTNGNLAAAAFAISELEKTKPQIHLPSSSSAPFQGIFFGQNQLQPAVHSQAIQDKTGQVVTELLQLWSQMGHQGQAALSSASLDSRKMDIATKADSPEVPTTTQHEGNLCQVTGSEELPVGVRLPEQIIKKIFDGCQAKLESTMKAATIADRRGNTEIRIGSIDFTLRNHKIESFTIPNALLNIEAVAFSDIYKVTIPNIEFDVAAEFTYRGNLLFCNSLEGAGSYNVVARKWSVIMTFKFEAAADRTPSFHVIECYCENDKELELVNFQGEQFMMTFKKSPWNYVRKQMRSKLAEAFKLLATQSAESVLRTVEIGTREELQLEKFYPGMTEKCILEVCNVTLTREDLRDDFMAINPNVVQHLPNNVVTPFTREQVRKTDQHNPSVQAKAIFLDALHVESIDPTKVRRLLAILEKVHPMLGKRIEEKHNLDIREHKQKCSKCH